MKEIGALNEEVTATQEGLRKSLSSGNSATEKEVDSVKQLQHPGLKVSMAASDTAASQIMSSQTPLHFMQGTNFFSDTV